MIARNAAAMPAIITCDKCDKNIDGRFAHFTHDENGGDLCCDNGCWPADGDLDQVFCVDEGSESTCAVCDQDFCDEHYRLDTTRLCGVVCRDCREERPEAVKACFLHLHTDQIMISDEGDIYSLETLPGYRRPPSSLTELCVDLYDPPHFDFRPSMWTTLEEKAQQRPDGEGCSVVYEAGAPSGRQRVASMNQTYNGIVGIDIVFNTLEEYNAAKKAWEEDRADRHGAAWQARMEGRTPEEQDDMFKSVAFADYLRRERRLPMVYSY